MFSTSSSSNNKLGLASVSSGVAPAVASSIPRPSQRVPLEYAPSDGDTWYERITICESLPVTKGNTKNATTAAATATSTTNTGPALSIRSYYRNSRTQERVWDEPPSGATRVQYATADMRKQAHRQLMELQNTLDMIPPDTRQQQQQQQLHHPHQQVGDDYGNEKTQDDDGNTGATPRTGATTSSLKKKVGPNHNNKKKNVLFSMFRGVINPRGANSQKQVVVVDDGKDLNLQRAIARSMVDQGGAYGNSHTDPIVYYDSEIGDVSTVTATGQSAASKDEEELALAIALSMSERDHAAAAYPATTAVMTEEEMLQRALEESKLDVQAHNEGLGVACMPKEPFHSSPVLLTTKKMAVKSNNIIWEEDEPEDNHHSNNADQEEMDRKLPPSSSWELNAESSFVDLHDAWNPKLPARPGPHHPKSQIDGAYLLE